MPRATRRAAQRKSVPLSVPVDPGMRARLARYARRTGVPLATGFRALAVARLDELEEEARLSRAQEWQRIRSWSLAQTVLERTAREAPLEDLLIGHEADLRRAHARTARTG